MKLEVYICDNCKCSINKNEIYHMKSEYACLHLCDRCKEKFSNFEEMYKNKFSELKNNYLNDMKDHFKNIYERLY